MPAPNPPQLRYTPASGRSVPAHGRAASAHEHRASAPTRTAFTAGRSASDLRGRILEAAPSSPMNALFRDGILLFLLFLLLWEWLRPMPKLSDMTDASLTPLLIVFGISILLDGLKVPYWLGGLIKAAALLSLIGYLFYPYEFPGISWTGDFIQVLIQDGMNLIQGHLDRVSPQSRTILFMLGWILMLTVTGALLLQRQHALWIVFSTLLYLIALQLMLGMDTTMGIIRTWGVGLLLLALLNLPRIERVYAIKPSSVGWPGRWLAMSLFAAVLTTGVGWNQYDSHLAKLMRPVDGAGMIQQWENYLLRGQEGGLLASRSVTRSGYGVDDSSLGGRMVPDDSLVFTATTPTLSYWRGESKSLYDGKGWSGTEPQWKRFEPDTSYLNPNSEAVTQKVMWNGAFSNKQIFYSGRLASVGSLVTNKGAEQPSEFLLRDTASDKITLPQSSEPILSYQITVHPIPINPSQLTMENPVYPQTITDAYLQLPDALPEKVRQLAGQITAGRDGPYAKATAIEQFLRSSFVYSLDKPTLPAANEDFVSHFLFVDQMGYCDHFSTAMVVMLRSVGIPARWVKGFAPGEAVTLEASANQVGGVLQVEETKPTSQLEQANSTMQTVQIRAKDAHSWVEVYFSSAGWIPFEPTPGFAGPASSPQDAKVLNTAVQQPVEALSLANLFAAADFIQREWKALALSLCGFTLLLAFILWGIQISTKKPQSTSDESQGKPVKSSMYAKIRLMDRVWLKIFRLFKMKPVHQTLREYVYSLQLPNGSQKQALLEFMHLYESLRYDREERYPFSRKQVREIWKSIKKGAR